MNWTAANWNLTAISVYYVPGTATIEVTIEDVDDNSPQWVMFEPFVPVWENATTGTVITTVQATDADTGVYGEVKYYMTSGNTDTFSLDADTVRKPRAISV